MTIQRILQVWDLFKSETTHPIENHAVVNPHQVVPSSPPRTYIDQNGSLQLDRRAATDRRHLERRRVNSHPYLDTRKNNGRRRSFGRRHRDQDLETPL